MKSKPFDDLSNLLKVDYSDQVKVFFNEHNDPAHKFTRHPNEDDSVVSFLTFVGGETKLELKAIALSLDCQNYQIRPSKRMRFSYELKIKGLKFQDLKTLISKLES